MLTNYLDVLQERFKHNIFDVLFQSVKFFTAEPENIKIRQLLKQKDPRVRLDCRKYSDGEFPAYFDARFPDYNANQYEGYFICEGAASDDTLSVERFLKNICFNPNCSIEHILVAGLPNQGNAKFYDYFTHDGEYGIYTINLIHSIKISTGIKYFELEITRKLVETTESKKINLYQLINMPDHQVANLDKTDLTKLYELCTTISPEHLIAHCAAGLGRSPTILFSFVLYKKFSQIFTGSNQHIADMLIKELNALRQIRPAAIQQLAQLKQAIQLALFYKTIDWERHPEKIAEDLKNIPKVCIIGAFDTKGEDYTFLREGIINNGCNVLTINIGVFKATSTFPINIDIDELLIGSDFNVESLQKENRPIAINTIKMCLERHITRIYEAEHFHGIIGLGGTNGTDVISAVMRHLPREIPKICVSTIAQHENWSYTKISGMIMMDSFTDVDGLNFISTEVYSNAIEIICNLSKRRLHVNALSPSGERKKLSIAISMFGTTTACVNRCKKALEQKGYECLVFHAVGTGGMKMEALVNDGMVDAVLDITTTEIADLVGNGIFSAGKTRLTAPGAKGIPHLIIPGCLDMINLGAYEQAKQQYPNRQLLKCNDDVTVMRTTVEENLEIGKIIAAKANAAIGPIAILLPLNGLSLFEKTIPGWHDSKANEALFVSLIDNSKANIPIIVMEANINDVVFADKTVEIMLALIQNRHIESEFIIDAQVPDKNNFTNGVIEQREQLLEHLKRSSQVFGKKSRMKLNKTVQNVESSSY